MALLQPAIVTAQRGQALTDTITIATDTTSWTATATLRAYKGGTALATKTVGSGITNTPGASSSTMVIAWSAADLTLAPGCYVWSLDRTNSGSEYPIIDSSGFIITGATGDAYPTLTNPSEFCAFVGLSETISDTDAKQLIIMLATAEEIIQRLCRRKFTYSASQTFYLDGNGTPDVMIPTTPVRTVASVYLDTSAYAGTVSGSFASTTLLTSGVDYYLVPDSPDGDGLSYSGILRKINGVWPDQQYRPTGYLGVSRRPCPGCIKTVATVGYSLIPYPLKAAVFELTEHLTIRAENGGRLPMSESGEGRSVSYGGMEEEAKHLASVQSVIAMYRRTTFVW